MSASAVRIGLIYPELLGTYGDRGNAITLERRLAWRGIEAEIVQVAATTPVPEMLDIYVIGGGEDAGQTVAAQRLRASSSAVRAAHARGAVIFGVCAGYQLLGERYEPAESPPVTGLGLIDAVTVAGTPRCVGECVVRPDDGLPLLTGFENHSGRTSLGPGVKPLGVTLRGAGNGDGTDGMTGERIVGTYLHGPVLVRNPALADRLLSFVVGSLAPIDDSIVGKLRQERLGSAGFSG